MLGRFLTPDWRDEPEGVPYADPTNPQSLNLYSYTHNNPLTYIDGGGHEDAPANSGAAPTDSSQVANSFDCNGNIPCLLRRLFGVGGTSGSGPVRGGGGGGTGQDIHQNSCRCSGGPSLGA